jgi:hypothetical protein
MTLNDQITQQIQKIVKDWMRANRHQPEIARLDRDILFGDLRLLYDLIDELEVAHHGADLSNPKPTVSERAENNVPLQVEKWENHFVATEKSETPEPANGNTQIPIPDAIETEDASSQALAQAIEKEMEKPARPPALNASINNRKPIKSTAEQFAPARTFADVYQKSDDTSLAAHIGRHAIPDIRTAIGVNDKFLFINEIFKGDVEAYQRTIDRLNRQSYLNDALLVIDEVKQKHVVNDKEAIDKLIKIIKRKFQN